MAITYTRNEIVLGDQQGRKQTVLTIPAQAATDKPGILVLQSVADGGVRTNYYVWVDSAGAMRIHTAIPTNQDGEGSTVTSGANTTLSNLTDTVAINKALLPGGTTNTLDLGSATKAWKTGYFGTSIVFDEATFNLIVTSSDIATADRTVNFPDPGANANIMLDTGAATAITYTKSTANITLGAAAQFDIAAAGNVDFGTGTYNFLGGIDIATGKTVDIDFNLTVNTENCTLNQSLSTTDAVTFTDINATSLLTTGSIGDGTMSINGTGVITGVASLAMTGAITGVTTIAASGAVTCQGIVNTVAVIDSTVAIQIGADNVNLTFGVDDATDSKIYFDGTHLMFDDSVIGGPYSLQQLATGTTLSPSVVGDLTILDGTFTWGDGTDEAAGIFTFVGTTVTDIAISSAVTSGKCLSITADALTTGDMLYLSTSVAGMGAGYFIRCFDTGGAATFTVAKYGATVITGTAAKTAALTLTTGDVAISNGQITVASTGDTVNKIARTNSTGTGPVLEVEDTATDGGVTFLVDSKQTGADDAMQITYAGTGSGLKVTNATATTGTQATFVGPASQSTKMVFVDGSTGPWIGVAATGMLHLSSSGALAAVNTSLLYSTYTGTIAGAASMIGTCGYFLDAGPASGTTYAVGIASTANNGLAVTNTAVGKSGVVVTGPSGQTAKMVSLVGTVTSGWIGAATTGMLHLASNGALAAADSSLLYSTYTGAIAAVDCVGTCAQFIDAGSASTHVYDVFAVGISSTANSGLKIATTSATAYGLHVTGPTAQTAKMVYLDGTTTAGWGGAANTGLLHIAGKGATLATTASHLLISIGTTAPTDSALGYALRIADTTAAAATNPHLTYAAYITATANSGMNITTIGTTGRNLVLAGPASQTVSQLTVDGSTAAWIGAASTGMVNLACSGTLANASASMLNIAKTGQTAATALGSCLAISDASTGGTTSGYSVYINSTGTIEALKVDEGICVFDESITLGVGAIFTPAQTNVTAGTPTDAEIDAGSLGTAASRGAGFMAVIDDANAHAALCIVISDGTTWHFIAATKCA